MTAPPAAPMIVGCPRSGTTLLRTFLDAHPEVAIPGESDVTVRLLTLGARQDGAITVDAARAIVESAPRLQAWGIDLERAISGVPRDRGGRVVAADVVRALHRTYAASHDRPRWGDKTPFHAGHLPLITANLPEVVVIHVIRDLRSVVAALGAVTWSEGGVVDAARTWRRLVGSARAAGAALGPDRYVEVRYEDLLVDPETHLRRICHLLGIDYDPVMLDRRDAAARARSQTSHPEDHHNLDRSLAPRRDWRSELSPLEVRRVEAVAGDLLLSCGYRPEHEPISVAATALRFGDAVGWSVRSRLERGRAAVRARRQGA